MSYQLFSKNHCYYQTTLSMRSFQLQSCWSFRTHLLTRHHRHPLQREVLLSHSTQPGVLPSRRCACFVVGRWPELGLGFDQFDPCENSSGQHLQPYKFRPTTRADKGSIGHTFKVCIHTENHHHGECCPLALLVLKISVLLRLPGILTAMMATRKRKRNRLS